MKNIALCIAGLMFLIVAVAQYLRYHLGIAVVLGTNHHISTEISLYASIVMFVLSIIMFIAAAMKK